MTQDAFNFEAKTEQQRQLKRVGGRIGEIVLEFCRKYRGEFHATLLHEYVKQRAGTHIAPDSPNRILRLLAKQGAVSYEVVNRSQSLYKITEVKGNQCT